MATQASTGKDLIWQRKFPQAGRVPEATGHLGIPGRRDSALVTVEPGPDKMPQPRRLITQDAGCEISD